MKTYEWWVDREDVVKMRQWCKKTTRSIGEYLIELFNLEIPCNVVVRLIKEGA